MKENKKESALKTAVAAVIEREKKQKRQQYLRRIQLFRNKLILCGAALLLGLNLCGVMVVHSFADVSQSELLTPCYTSVQIKAGESLWTIASDYYQDSPMDIREYVQELKRMNGLKSDTIHAGHYLTVVYYR